jgi:hypothetical protein
VALVPSGLRVTPKEENKRKKEEEKRDFWDRAQSKLTELKL